MTHMGVEEGHETVAEYQRNFREYCPAEIYLIDLGINGVCWADRVPVEAPEFAAPPESVRYVRADTTIPPEWLLAPKHTGMKISAPGMLRRVGGKLRFGAQEMLKHLNEAAERFYAGDVKAIDEFFQLYDLDEKRPQDQEVPK